MLRAAVPTPLARAATPLRTAIVGAGLMGRWHADAAVRAGARIHVIVDRDRDRAATLATSHDGARAVTDVADIDDVDVVHICTPLESHVAIARAALDAGRHTLIEKPLAPSAAETAALLDLAASRGALLCPVHQLLFQDGVVETIARRDALGRLRHIAIDICSAGADQGDGGLRDRIAREILPHPLSLLYRLAPGAWAASEWALRSPEPGEIRALAEVNGISASIVVSLAGRPTRHRVEVTGTLGTTVIDLFHGFAVAADGAVSRRRKIARPFSDAASLGAAASANLLRRVARREPAYPGLRPLVAAFYEAVRAGSESPLDREEVIGVAVARDRMLAAIDLAPAPGD